MMLSLGTTQMKTMFLWIQKDWSTSVCGISILVLLKIAQENLSNVYSVARVALQLWNSTGIFWLRTKVLPFFFLRPPFIPHHFFVFIVWLALLHTDSLDHRICIASRLLYRCSIIPVCLSVSLRISFFAYYVDGGLLRRFYGRIYK